MKSIDILIETVAGSREKFNYHPETRTFKFKKALPYGMCFPFDFGCIPNTTGGDGDSLDVMIISEFKTFTGCIISCRLIGYLSATQQEPGKPAFRNDRFFAIPDESIQFQHIHHIDDLPEKLMADIQAFFIQYNSIEGKTFDILGLHGPKEALNALEKGYDEYSRQYS